MFSPPLNLLLTSHFAATLLQNLGDVRQEDDDRQQHIRLKGKMEMSCFNNICLFHLKGELWYYSGLFVVDTKILTVVSGVC